MKQTGSSLVQHMLNYLVKNTAKDMLLKHSGSSLAQYLLKLLVVPLEGIRGYVAEANWFISGTTHAKLHCFKPFRTQPRP